MNSKATVFSLVIAISAVAGISLAVPFHAGQIASAADEGMTHGAGIMKGQIASVQPDSEGKPAWIQSGIWVARITSADHSHPAVQLVARFTMIKPDGTAMHMHRIYDFKATEMTQEGNSTGVLKGTVTVTMPNGPVADVPVTVKVFGDSVVGFWIGPDKVNGHFGTTPVYGILSANSRAAMANMHSMMQEMNRGPGAAAGQTNSTIKMSTKEVEGVYRWSTDAGINPTLKLANANTVIQIQNPTDEKHELVIEGSNGAELASSGDIGPDSSGQLTFKPATTGTFGYHCEYHPDTMKGTIQVG